jgi:hypothetical protein
MSLALTTTHENGIFRGVSLPFLRHILLSQHSPFGLHCRVRVIDYTLGQGYNVSVGMVSCERWDK